MEQPSTEGEVFKGEGRPLLTLYAFMQDSAGPKAFVQC